MGIDLKLGRVIHVQLYSYTGVFGLDHIHHSSSISMCFAVFQRSVTIADGSSYSTHYMVLINNYHLKI